jgi:hypothetical protein
MLHHNLPTNTTNSELFYNIFAIICKYFQGKILQALLFTLCQPLSHMETSSLDTLSLVLGLGVSMCDSGSGVRLNCNLQARIILFPVF